jgi:hypothetical protein
MELYAVDVDGDRDTEKFVEVWENENMSVANIDEKKRMYFLSYLNRMLLCIEPKKNSLNE